MNVNMDALKALELKLAEYCKVNGSIAEHESANVNCKHTCMGGCYGSMKTGCGTCQNACYGRCLGSCTGAGKIDS